MIAFLLIPLENFLPPRASFETAKLAICNFDIVVVAGLSDGFFGNIKFFSQAKGYLAAKPFFAVAFPGRGDYRVC
jgi:hypothetical protein